MVIDQINEEIAEYCEYDEAYFDDKKAKLIDFEEEENDEIL